MEISSVESITKRKLKSKNNKSIRLTFGFFYAKNEKSIKKTKIREYLVTIDKRRYF